LVDPCRATAARARQTSGTTDAYSTPVTRLFDVRAGEARGSILGFAVLLLLVIGAHTILETARDALLLTGPGPRALGMVYMAIAVGTLPATALAARAGVRFGQRRALGGVLAFAVAGPALLFLLPMSHGAAIAIYVLSGLLSSTVVPQFWTLLGTVLTASQGRRLFGLISAGGIVGAVLGAAAASTVLVWLPVKSLLLGSSLVFGVAIASLGSVKVTERAPAVGPTRRAPLLATVRAFREQPFLARVALVVFLSTATFLALDYLFKSTVARSLPSDRVGPFVAHFYLALNGLSLVVQLLVTSTVVRRLGVLPALVVTPMLLLLGSVAAFVGGGALPGVLAVKSIDGGLRYSIHRVSGELMVLPVPAPARQRTKPILDGALGRAAQTLTGAGLIALGASGHVGPELMTAIVATLSLTWLATVLTMRRPYLRLLRGAVTAGSVDASEPEPIDLETAQMLVQRLASDDPLEVEGAIMALSRRGRTGFVPALVLLHHDERILVQALETFGTSTRSDWFALARRLLDDPRETVRIAAARALARHEQLDPTSLANDAGLRARGYAAVRMALRDASTDVMAQGTVRALLEPDGEAGEAARLGMLAAIADAHPTPRLVPLLRDLARHPQSSRERTELFAAAAARQKDPMLLPALVSLLSAREGRETVRTALVQFGQPGLEEVWRTLRDPTCSRRLRVHMPKTLARFATKGAANYLLDEIATETDGLVRYKAIRALRLLVTEHRIFVDRRRTEALCCAEVEAHFRCLALRAVPDLRAGSTDAAARALLLRLLDEKAVHALERAFHLLQIAHPRQGVHHAYLAYRGSDAYARANAAELLDTLLRRRDQQRLRALFRVATDELSPAERVERARSLVPHTAQTLDDVVEAIGKGQDPMLVALARRMQPPRASGRISTAPPLAEAK
jgi:AAA family ATP:ADP antiporter